jgi:CheY-like chemotaxis protein
MNLESLRMLVVDDNPDFVRAACEWMTVELGVIVIGTAADGRAALAAVERLRPHLVLMDVVMPGMDGIEATRRMKARPDAPVVVLITLHDSDVLRDTALDAGADAVLSKNDLGGSTDLLRPLFRVRGG